MGVIDEIKQRVDIVEVASEYVPGLKKVGRNFKALCPFHVEKTPSFYVFPERQSWHCFGACGSGGDVFSFVMKKEGVDFGEALRLLSRRAGIELVQKQPSEYEKKAERLKEINQAAAEYYHKLLLRFPALDYLTRRGISSKAIEDFQLGFSLDSWNALRGHLIEIGYDEEELLAAGLLVGKEEERSYDRFRNRLMFPIRDITGRTLGFGARSLDDSLPKYINSPETKIFEKSNILYGIDRAKTSIRRQNLAIVVEGYMDVIAAHQYGYENVVASMGTALTERQVGILKKLTKNLTLALDADAAGEMATLRGEEVIAHAFDQPFDAVASKLDLTKVGDKSSAVDQLSPVINDIKDPIRRAHYVQKLAHLVRIDERTLDSALKRVKPSKPRREAGAAQPSALVPPLSSGDPLEEYCLCLLISHPKLREWSGELSADYFERSENREIFLAWRSSSDLDLMREQLDIILQEHLDALLAKTLPPMDEEAQQSALTDCIYRLQERWLRTKRDFFSFDDQLEGDDTD